MDEKPKLILIGDLFRQSWRLYRERFWTLAGVAALGVLVIGVTFGLDLAAGFLSYTYTFTFSVVIAIASLAALTIYLLVPFLLGLALIYAVRGDGVISSWRLAIQNMISFGWLRVLHALIVLGGLLMLIIPGIIFYIWFIVSSYVFAIDGEKGMSALLKSREYIRGSWWRIVWRLIVPIVVFSVIAALIFLLISLILAAQIATSTGGAAAATLTIFFAASALITIVLVAAALFWVSYLYVLYKNLKRLKPEVASQPASGPRGFFYFSAVLGVVSLIVALLLFSFSGI